MLEILYDLCISKQFAAFYTNQDTTKFHFGSVLAVNETEIALQLISPDGEDDGITVINVDRVFRVEVSGQYHDKMKKLCAGRTRLNHALKMDKDGVLASVLSYASSNKHIVSLELLDSGIYDIVGLAEYTPDGNCCIHQIDEYGFDDGRSYISVKDITMLRLLSEDEKRILRLWQVNKQ